MEATHSSIPQDIHWQVDSLSSTAIKIICRPGCQKSHDNSGSSPHHPSPPAAWPPPLGWPPLPPYCPVFAKDSLPFGLWKNNHIFMQESGEYVLSIPNSDHSIEYQASYKEDGEDGGQQKDDDHPIKARCILPLHHSYVPDKRMSKNYILKIVMKSHTLLLQEV